MTANHSKSAIHRYFAGLAENTFQAQLGVVDPVLIDYVSDLLIRFIRLDSVHKFRGLTGRPLMSVKWIRSCPARIRFTGSLTLGLRCMG